ncbi:hypothetical protein DMENIID0001_004030 [Sergentomyia squamirostris]
MESVTKVCLISVVMVTLINTVMSNFPYVCRLAIDKYITILDFMNIIIIEKSHCSCSIIAPDWVLTAGHCIVLSTSIFESVIYTIQFGTTYVDNPDLVSIREVSENRAYQHPNFNETTLESDVGLIYVSSKFDLESDPSVVSSIKINCPPIISVESAYLTAAGFGYINNDNTLPTQLYFTNELQYMDLPNCQNEWQSTPLPNTCFCAWDFTTPVSSICNGDSGCPILLPDTLLQIGIGSFGTTPCNALPQGFTDLSNVNVCNWITEKTGNIS